MEGMQEKYEKPKLAIIYAYIITFGSIAGLIFFLIIYYTKSNLWYNYFALSPVVFALTMLVSSGLGLITGSGLLSRKKYGWILTQFLLIYLIIRASYNLLILPFLIPTQNPLVHIIKYLIIIVLSALILLYFNNKVTLKYYGVENEEAKRLYLISLLTCIIVIILSNFV